MFSSNKFSPTDFTYLREVDPTIIQSVRYAGSENFVGHPLIGYNSCEIVMTRICAETLINVQKKVIKQGLKLVVYDAYRPQKTVNYFNNTWRYQPVDAKCSQDYYPYLTKNLIFDNNYIAAHSSHSRGSTVDLTLIKINDVLVPPIRRVLTLLNGESLNYLDDGTVDMGTSFDMFHPASHHGSDLITADQIANREILLEVMQTHGFKKHPEEWWHYTLIQEPFPDTYFDFDIMDLI